MAEIQKELMTVEEFLQIYSISRSMYFSHAKKGYLKITQVGRRTLIKRTDAEIWLNKIDELV